MTQDDLPPVPRRPRVAFTWWWVIAGTVVAAGIACVVGFHGPAKHDRPGLNTVELSHAQPG